MASATGVFEFAPFVVEATGRQGDLQEAPYAVSVVEADAIRRANLQVTLDGALFNIPGVFILNPYNYAQDTRIAIRGFGARADFGIRGIRLLVDGLPATTPDGQGEVDGIDLGSAGRIEVLRGPSAALYGAASGGVIRIETEPGPGVPFFETRVTAGANDYLNLQGKSGGQKSGLNWMLSGSGLTGDGHREHSGTEQNRANGKLTYQLKGGARLGMVINVIDFPLQNDPGGLTREEAEADPEQARARNRRFDAGEEVAQQRIGMHYSREDSSTGLLDLAAWYIRRDFANRLPFESGGQVAFLRNAWGSRVLYSRELGTAVFSLGSEVHYQDDDRRNYDNLEGERGPLVLDQNERVRGLGAFAFYERPLTKHLSLSSAIRYDSVDFEVGDALLTDGDDSGDVAFKEISPMLGLVLKFAPRHSLYANASTSFETPTTTEFDNPRGGGFNPDLTSQTARNLELGARGGFSVDEWNFIYTIALFHIDIDDALVPYELPAFPDREFYRNAGASRRLGVEADLEVRYGRHLSARFVYAWSDFTYERFVSGDSDYSGNRIPGIPVHHGSIILGYESPTGLFASWRTRLSGSFYADDANRERIDAWSVTDLRIGYRWEEGAWTIEPFLGINNLFNTAYYANIRINAFGGRHFEPGPGRHAYGGLRVRYAFP